MILTQAMWEVQAIRNVDQEKLLMKDGAPYRSMGLVHRNRVGFIVSRARDVERLRIQ